MFPAAWSSQQVNQYTHREGFSTPNLRLLFPPPGRAKEARKVQLPSSKYMSFGRALSHLQTIDVDVPVRLALKYYTEQAGKQKIFYRFM